MVLFLSYWPIADDGGFESLNSRRFRTRIDVYKEFDSETIFKAFSMEGIQLHFTKTAIKAIADKAIALKTGARALRSIMEKIMLDIMYEIPSLEGVSEVQITSSVIEGRKPKS